MEMGDDDHWEPPSEAMMKVLQARRERSDRISKLMGDYLLKGYKMLGTSCPQCGTILLQTKQGTNYCIACSELDSDTDKDDPVTSQVAALTQVREGGVREATQSSSAHAGNPSSAPYTPQTPLHTSTLPAPPTHTPTPTTTTNPTTNPTPPNQPPIRELSSQAGGDHMQVDRAPLPPPASLNTTANASTLASGAQGGWGQERCLEDLMNKLQWACSELRATHSVDYSLQLCQLIKGCAEAISSVKAALTLSAHS